MMVHDFCWLPLGQANRLSAASNQFRQTKAKFDTGDLVLGLLILAGVVVAVWVMTRLLSRQERRRAYNNPRAMFRQLGAAHGLGHVERSLLQDLATVRGLDPPVHIFLEPDAFDLATLPPAMADRAQEIDQLRDRLFAEATSPEAPCENVEDSALHAETASET